MGGSAEERARSSDVNDDRRAPPPRRARSLPACALRDRVLRPRPPWKPTRCARGRIHARPSRYRIDYAGELNQAQHEAATTLEGPRPGHRRRGQRQDADARLPRRAPGRVGRQPGARPPAHLHAARPPRRCCAARRRSSARAASGSRAARSTPSPTRCSAAPDAPIGLEPGFTILDRGDSEDVVNLLRAPRRPRPEGPPLPAQGHDPRDLQHGRQPERDRARGRRGELRRTSSSTSTTSSGSASSTRATSASKSLVDYDDLLVHLRDLLRDHPDVAAQLSRTYRYVMVDEYQDTNRLQAEIVRGLAVAHDNVMAVGDDSQSIYSFRGADFRNIMDFPSLFPGTRVHHARGELPLDAADPRPRQRDHRPRRARSTRRCCARAPRRAASRRCSSQCARRAGAVALRLPAHPRAARGGRVARRDRGALPLELPLLRPRARAAARATSRSSSAAASSSSRRRT